MSYLAHEKQLEKKSRRIFRELLHPWTITIPEDDTGIDLYIQPLDEKGSPLNSFFKAQLKSTSKKINRKPKAKIDLIHIRQWLFSVKIQIFSDMDFI